MKYVLLIVSLVILPTCGMLSRYSLIQCVELQEMQCESIKTFTSEEICEKFARELNIDSTINIYYCEEKGVFQK